MGAGIALSLLSDQLDDGSACYDAEKPLSDLNLSRPSYARSTSGDGKAERPDAARLNDRIDAAVDEMRAFLTFLEPESDAEALQSLRLAFPTAPLADRIAAIKNRFFAE